MLREPSSYRDECRNVGMEGRLKGRSVEIALKILAENDKYIITCAKCEKPNSMLIINSQNHSIIDRV